MLNSLEIIRFEVNTFSLVYYYFIKIMNIAWNCIHFLKQHKLIIIILKSHGVIKKTLL